ncbi:hypothetical protein HKD37_12G034500 [Glycine soja]
MALIPDKIREINGFKETLKLVIRITDLWFVGTQDKFEQPKMVIVDSNGDQIHAVCKKNQLKSWNPILKKFANFERGLLVDIIDVVDELIYQQISSENKRVVFKLKDLSDQLVSCTLWEDYYLQFLEYLNESNGEGPIVILLTHARIKESQGIVTVPNNNKQLIKSIKIGLNSLCLFLPLILFLILQTYRIKKHNPTMKQAHNRPILASFQQTIHFCFKSLSEINVISEVLEIVCFTVSTIGRIVMDNHSWCCTVCIKCNNKTDKDNIPFTCACCKYNQQTVLRYRLEVIVYHKEQSTKFMLWNRECITLIGQLADEVNRLKITVSYLFLCILTDFTPQNLG